MTTLDDAVLYAARAAVAYYSRKGAVMRPQADAYLGVAWIGAHSALRTFDAAKGRLLPHLVAGARRAIWTELRHEGRQLRVPKGVDVCYCSSIDQEETPELYTLPELENALTRAALVVAAQSEEHAEAFGCILAEGTAADLGRALSITRETGRVRLRAFCDAVRGELERRGPTKP